MIPNKNLFLGSLGKVQNIGGSKIFTTPHTISVKPNYTIAINTNDVYLTCSLDGRLWVFRNTLIALKWNETTKHLEFAASKTIKTSLIVFRGLDWILTNKAVYLVKDEAPYIFTENLYNGESAQRVLYSILRSKVLSETPRGFTADAGPGLDPFTRAAWGMNSSNGNSEGWAFFSNLLLYPEGSHTMEQCYSLLPSIGDWQIIENFLIRRPDNPLKNSNQIAPLIPLEFNLYSKSRSVSYPLYGTGYNLNHRGIQLFIHDGELWARGIMHVGKVSILPAVFHEDGTIKDYYLYISPEYILGPYNQRTTPDMQVDNNWLNLAFISTDNLTGFLSEQSDGFCQVSSDGKFFSPDTKEWTDVVSGSSGKLFIDTANSSALFLGDKGLKFIGTNKSFECNALSQWVAPANQIESVSEDLIISSFDNNTLVTYVAGGFSRELLSQRKLHLSARPINEKRFSMGYSDENILVNEVSSKSSNIPDRIDWDDIYKPAVSIKLLNINTNFPGGSSTFLPIWISNKAPENEYQYHEYISKNGYIGDHWYDHIKMTLHYSYIDPNTGLVKTPSTSISPISYDDLSYEYMIEESSKFPVNGGILPLHPSEDVRWENVYFFYSASLDVINHNLTWVIKRKSYFSNEKLYPMQTIYKSVSLSSSVTAYESSGENGLTLDKLCFSCETLNNAVSNKLACCINAVFTEASTNTKFVLELPPVTSIDNNGNVSGAVTSNNFTIYNYGNTDTYKKNYRNQNRTMTNLHVAIQGSTAIVFRSEINPYVFNFDNELLRSELS